MSDGKKLKLLLHYVVPGKFCLPHISQWQHFFSRWLRNFPVNPQGFISHALSPWSSVFCLSATLQPSSSQVSPARSVYSTPDSIYSPSRSYY
jgi:hypothetical protein